ncbi:MAG: GxxExxY protein [Planctomycetaceae bacterium]|nr:GxxExxY protein [Planctomycetaceae bacterium]
MEFQELTNKVIGAAFTVYNRMGFGFLESVYEKCLLLELQKAGILAENQAEILVKYDDKVVGEFKADLLVENEVIIELKSIKTIMQIHEVQLVNYLKATGKDLGLLINFGEKGVQVKRKIRNLEKISREDSDNSVDPVILSKENPVDPV